MRQSEIGVGVRRGGKGAQEKWGTPDVGMPAMQNTAKVAILESAAPEGRRTILALVSASIISLVVWGLVIALNVH